MMDKERRGRAMWVALSALAAAAPPIVAGVALSPQIGEGKAQAERARLSEPSLLPLPADHAPVTVTDSSKRAGAPSADERTSFAYPDQGMDPEHLDVPPDWRPSDQSKTEQDE